MSPRSDLSESTARSAFPVQFDDCRVVRAHGELDVTTVPRLERALRQVRTGQGRLRLIVDLSAVTFADGSILEPLCEAWAESRERHGWTRVVYTRSATSLVFRAGGLADRFPGYASVQDARHGAGGHQARHDGER
ncbi:STAS domain-containing protein [Streptomyces sp. UC4497]